MLLHLDVCQFRKDICSPIENSVKLLSLCTAAAVLGEEWSEREEWVAKQLKDVLRLMYIIFTH